MKQEDKVDITWTVISSPILHNQQYPGAVSKDSYLFLVVIHMNTFKEH
jgi:hypothetical protein